MTWVMRWRERVIANESNERKDDRGNRKNTVFAQALNRCTRGALLRTLPRCHGSAEEGYSAGR
jgi:hypothetical protein